MDSNERALMVAMGTDFYYCLYCPALVLYACPSVRRSFRTVIGIRRGQHDHMIHMQNTYINRAVK